MKIIYPEGATPIDDDELIDLIPDHITLLKELNEWEQINIASAYEFYFNKSYKFDEILNYGFILEVHKRMFNNTWRWAGQQRKTIKNIGVDTSQIPAATYNLCNDTKYWIENKSFSSDEIGARFHHRLVAIHIFANGNGRHSRFVTDLLLRSIKIKLFSWGSKNLYDESETRSEYIKSLKKADNNDYDALLKFVRS